MQNNSSSGIIIAFIIFFIIIGFALYFGFKSGGTATDQVADTSVSADGAQLPIAQDNSMEQQNGLQITTEQEGTGTAVVSGNQVTVNYTGSLSDGTVFDSNVDPKFGHVEPFTVTIGVGQVIKGWDEGIIGMKVGEKRKLVIPSDLAYGPQGAGALIPPNATLTFEVELLAIK